MGICCPAGSLLSGPYSISSLGGTMKTSMMTLCIVFIVALLCADCRGADNSTLIAKETQKTLTKEAFLRVEPTIKSLIPEQPIHSVGLKWPVLGIREGKKLVG